MHEACLRVSRGYSWRSRIQTDTEIIAITGILINTDHTFGSATMYLEIGELGKIASVKMCKRLDVIAMRPV